MINITYNIWNEACNLVQSYAKKYGKFYLQLYPFYNFNNLEIISSKNFFDLYVNSGAMLANYSNFDRIDNYCKKSDGSFRKRFLLTPIIYIYYIAIGLYISSKYKQTRNAEIFVKYGGDFEKKDLHYRNSYKDFVTYVSDKSLEYNYYCKLDISDFFNKLDINLLTKRLSVSFSFNQKEQMVFKEFISWCGGGNFPQTECGVTSSYLATIVYFDIIDNRLYNLLSKENTIKKFKICRYVDDLYILLDIDEDINTDIIENKINAIYENIIYNYDLSINRNKSCFKKTEYIFSDLKSFSILEDFDMDIDIPIEYKKHLFDFLSELVILSENKSINYQKYIKLIDKYFEDPESTYHAGQILYVLVYKNISWLRETKIIKKITKLIDTDFNVLSIDPKRLISLIVNTHDEEVIKKFLNKLYYCAEKGNWLISHNFMALQYLLYRSFASDKLIGKMEMYCPENGEFIKKYYKSDWQKIIISDDIKRQVNKLKYTNAPISFFKFLEILSIKNENILQAQAYNKNYFDAITKNIELTKAYAIDKGKLYYSKEDLKSLYMSKLKISKDQWQIINNLCDKRNSNPLCHANCNIFTNKKDLSSVILKDINGINNLISEIIDIYI